MKISEKTCVEFVNLLASKSAVPGGGGAAALVGLQLNYRKEKICRV